MSAPKWTVKYEIDGSCDEKKKTIISSRPVGEIIVMFHTYMQICLDHTPSSYRVKKVEKGHPNTPQGGTTHDEKFLRVTPKIDSGKPNQNWK